MRNIDTPKMQKNKSKSTTYFYDLAEKIADENEGIPVSGGFLIRCQCKDHPDLKPSCKITPTATQLLVHCMKCDADGGHRSFDALAERYSLYPENQKPMWFHLWENATEAGVNTQLYFDNRGIGFFTDWPETFRESDELRIRESEDVFSGLVLLIQNESGEPIGIHRILLNGDASGKAPIDNPKRSLGEKKGGHITVRQGSSKTLQIGEGLESSVAISRNLPESCTTDTVWSAISGGNFESLGIPSCYEIVHLWGDRDPDGYGARCIKKLAINLYNEGRTVFIHLPKERTAEAVDYNDALDEITSAFQEDTKFSPLEWEADNITLPQDYEIREDGVFKFTVKQKKDGPETIETKIAGFPVYISSCLIDIDDKTEVLTVKYYHPILKQYLTKDVSRASITCVKSLLENVLGGSKIQVLQQHHKAFCDYLMLCSDMHRTGNYVSKFIRWVSFKNKKEFVPFSDTIALVQPDNAEFAPIAKAYKETSGTFEKWHDEVLLPVSRCPGASVVFAFNLVSPLLNFLSGVPAFVVNVASETTAGKTVSVCAAFSSFCKNLPGDGGESPLILSGDKTSPAGFSQVLNFHRDLSICIDDAQRMKPDEIESIIYDIGNSSKTVKSKRDGQLRASTVSRSVVFITSEVDFMKKIRFDGANVRMVIVDEPPLGNLTVDERIAVATSLSNNYGHFGRRYIRTLEQIANNTTEDLQAFYTVSMGFLKKITSTGDPAFIERQTKLYAAALVALHIMRLTLNDDTVTKIIRQYLVDHWQKAVTSRMYGTMPYQALQELREFVTGNYDMFNPKSLYPGERYGEIQPDGSVAFLGRYLTKILKGGFDTQNVVSQWKRLGWLRQNSQSLAKRGNLDLATVNNQKSVQCIVIKKEHFGFQNDEENPVKLTVQKAA